VGQFRAKRPKSADKLADALRVLLRFCDYPAEYWLHLKTSNHRVDLLDGQTEDEGSGISSRRARRGHHSDRGHRAPLALRQRRLSCHPRVGRSDLPRGVLVESELKEGEVTA